MLTSRHPHLTLMASLLLVLAMLPGVYRLTINTDGAALIPDQALEVQHNQELRREFGLNDQAVVLVDGGSPGSIYTVDNLRLIQRLSTRLQELPEIGPLNVASLATELSDRYIPGELTFYTLLAPFPEDDPACQRVRDDVEANGLYVGTLASRDGSAAAILIGTPEGIDRIALSRTVWEIIGETESGSAKVNAIGAPFAEALLGNHILEDLGVPASVLGHPRASDFAARDATGLYALRSWVGDHIGLLPIAIIVMALVFLVGFRSPVAMMLPLLQVGSCLIFTFGLMGYVGVPLYLTTAVLPVILTCIGVADEVHILGRYVQLALQDRQRPRAQLVQQTMSEMRRPVVRTSVTTSIGFLSFTLSPIVPVQMFGLFATIGILFCMAWSLLATPALLTILPTSTLRPMRGKPATSPSPPGAVDARGRPGGFTGIALRAPGAILLVTVLLALVAVAGIQRLQVQDSWIDGFDRQSAFYRATKKFHQQFFGTHILQVCIDTGHRSWRGELSTADVHDNVYRIPWRIDFSAEELRGAILRVRTVDSTLVQNWDRLGNSSDTWVAMLDSVVVYGDSLALYPSRRAGTANFHLRLQGKEALLVELETRRLDTYDTLMQIQGLEKFLRTRREYTVGGVVGPADYLATTQFIYLRRDPEQRVIPRSPAKIAPLWQHFGRVRGAHYVHRVINENHTRAILSVYLKNANYQDTQRLMQEIRDYEAIHLLPTGIRLAFAGDVAVSQTLIHAIVRTQVWSLVFSLLGILLVSILLNRSLRLGLLTMIPCALAILLNFGFMGWTGMPLGVATSMFAGMVLGVGVDFAIHLLDRYERLRAAGEPSAIAMAGALSIAGRPILLDGAAVALGFGVLTLSRVPANARLGALAVLGVTTCVLGTLALLPSLLRPRRERD